MTEAAHQMTSNPLRKGRRKPGSVGISAGPDLAIMDDMGHLLPVGEIGEVVIRGANVMAGYENNPAANGRAFSHGWFRTGDQGRFDADGDLFLTGRLKEIINRGGEKIAPREIDEILAQHPAIAEAITFAVPHATLGEDVAAAVVPRDDAAVTEAEIRRFAALRLADAKVPSRILLVREIPRGPTGKPQRIGLAEKLGVTLRAEFIAPHAPVEQRLAEIWQRRLRVEQVGVRDNFFALGGDSLAVAGMMIEVEEHFGGPIAVGTFLGSPTIETLGRLVDTGRSVAGIGAGDRAPARSSWWRSTRPVTGRAVSGSIACVASRSVVTCRSGCRC
jgi:acyl carrier protein